MSTKLARRLIEPDYWTCPHGVRTRPEAIETYGPEVAEVNAAAGFAPDPQQELALDLIFAIRPDGSPASFEFCVICCRQNLKTGLFKQAAIGWLYVTEQRLIVWSAHEMSTTNEAQRELGELMLGSPALRRRMMAQKNDGIYSDNGAERIELATGQRILFKARTRDGGRGLAVPKLILDEAFALKASMMGSLIPLMMAQQDPQVLYGSSAGKADSEVLFDIRDRGRNGSSPRMSYLEWLSPREECESEDCTHAKSGVKGCALDRPHLRMKANPTITTGRISLETLDDMRQAMPPAEFMRECLGWWDDPAEGGEERLDEALWTDMRGVTSEDLSALAFGITVHPDRSRAVIGVSGRRSDGFVQVEVVAEGRGTRWPVDWITSRIPTWHPCAVILDGTAASLAPLFEDLGIEAVTTSSTDRAQASVGFYDDFMAARLRQPGELLLDEAVRTSTRRKMRDGFVWDGPNSSPLAAVSLAHWGMTVFGGPVEKPPPASPKPVRTSKAGSYTSDLLTTGF